ncbi:transposable element Tcb1 transposase [Trichonephila clavipes]|nr:transposable element Tcb1 transposase [Trichonephila clavipes]
MPGKGDRRYFSQLSEFERGLIIGMKPAGWSMCRVAGQVDRSEKTTRTDDRRIVSQALVDPTVTYSTIRAYVGIAIVPQTISRHLAEANLKSKRPFRALPLTPEHRQLRLQWCQARSMWNVTDWKKVVFSDASRFVLGTDDNRVRVWRRPAYDSRSTLIVMRGTLTGQRYVDDILLLHVGPFLNGLPGAIFQQDNARPHTARVAQDFLRHFQTLPWPARSSDLSPVEHLTDGKVKSPVVKVSDHGRHVMSSSPVPLKTRHVGQRCTLNLSRAETSSHWCGVVVRRGGQLRSRPRHLTMVQNYVVRRQKPSCS